MAQTCIVSREGARPLCALWEMTDGGKLAEAGLLLLEVNSRLAHRRAAEKTKTPADTKDLLRRASVPQVEGMT